MLFHRERKAATTPKAAAAHVHDLRDQVKRLMEGKPTISDRTRRDPGRGDPDPCAICATYLAQ